MDQAGPRRGSAASSAALRPGLRLGAPRRSTSRSRSVQVSASASRSARTARCRSSTAMSRRRASATGRRLHRRRRPRPTQRARSRGRTSCSTNATLEPDADRDGLGDETQDADRDGARTLLGRRSRTVTLPPLQVQRRQLALVRVRDGRSFVEAFDLDDKRRIFSTPRTSDGGPPASWRVTDLVDRAERKGGMDREGDRRRSDARPCRVRNRTRVQEIDQGRIRPTSLQLASDAIGINYIRADGSARNSGF